MTIGLKDDYLKWFLNTTAARRHSFGVWKIPMISYHYIAIIMLIKGLLDFICELTDLIRLDCTTKISFYVKCLSKFRTAYPFPKLDGSMRRRRLHEQNHKVPLMERCDLQLSERKSKLSICVLQQHITLILLAPCNRPN